MTEAGPPLLAVEHVTKRRGTRSILEGVSLEVRAGELVGVSGARGAGKRALLELIVGNEQPDSGRIVFNGEDVTGLPAATRRRMGLASPLQQPSLYHRLREAVRPMSLEERLAVAVASAGAPSGRARDELIDDMLATTSLLDARKRRLTELSAGQRERARMAELQIGRPKLIVLDEPLKSFDPATMRDLEAHLRWLSGQTAVLISDRSGEANRLCDRIYTLADGKIGPAGAAIKVFINYRRGDDPGFAQALFQQLEPAFGASRLFMDVAGALKPGDDYSAVLRQKVEGCEALLVVIGPRWLEARDEHGRSRLQNPADWVRVEIVSALTTGKQVIPVLVGGASMPAEADLPEPLWPLLLRQAMRINADSFRPDAERLVRHLQSVRPR